MRFIVQSARRRVIEIPNLILRCICDNFNVLYGERIDTWMITRDGGFECNLFCIETVFIIPFCGIDRLAFNMNDNHSGNSVLSKHCKESPVGKRDHTTFVEHGIK
jgi:hypothetical protein